MVCRPPALAPPIPPTAPHHGWQADVKGDEPVAGCKLRVAPSSSTWELSAGAKFCKLTSITQPNGSAQIFSYDAAGQLLSMVNRAPGGAVQSRFEYTYYMCRATASR